MTYEQALKEAYKQPWKVVEPHRLKAFNIYSVCLTEPLQCFIEEAEVTLKVLAECEKEIAEHLVNLHNKSLDLAVDKVEDCQLKVSPPTKTLKDLTEENIRHIVSLVYPFEDWIKSSMEIRYQPYDKTWHEDAAEFWFVKFQGITFGDKVDTYRLWLYPSLAIEFDAIRTNVDNMTDEQRKEYDRINIVFLGSFPVRNQYQIYEYLRELNIKPV